MSIQAVLQGAAGGFAKGGVTGILGGALGGFLGGGNGGPNIAKSLSKQVGCTILQSDANQARAMLQRGVNPCTGQNTRVTDSFDTGVGPGGLGGMLNTVGINPGAAMPIPVSQAPVVTGPGGTLMAARTGGGALEYTATGLIRNVIVNGRRISRKNAAAFIRKAGMDVGAQGLGISLQQAAMVVLQQSARPRRRRGISGAQITQAKRVINTINSMAKQLGCSTPRRRAPARKSTCR